MPMSANTVKMIASQKAQIKRGKAPQAAIQRSIAGPTVFAKVIYDKFITILASLPSGKGMGTLWPAYQ